MKIIILYLFLFFQFSLSAKQEVVFCVQAHQDDWQLFNSKNIINDLNLGKKVVFITVCSGDLGSKKDGNNPVFLVRERGAVYSSKFVQDICKNRPSLLTPPQKVNIISQDGQGNSVSRYILQYNYQNTVNYFLRLPEGNIDGKGFRSNNYESLKKLQNGQIKSIEAIDGTTVYSSWTDLRNTIRQIILNERGENEQLWMYINSIDGKYNPKDHSDHYCVSSLAIEAVADYSWIGVTEWMSYNSSNHKPNLSQSEIEDATALFTVYNWAMLEYGYSSHHNNHHNKWLSRNYTRVYRNPSGGFSKPKQAAKIQLPMIVSHYKKGNNAKLGKLILKINIIEKGEMDLKIYNFQGDLLYSNIHFYQDGGIKTVEIENIEQMNIINVVLNNKYFDTKKIQ